MENGYVKPYSTSQSGPEIKYPLQGEMSGKGSLLAKPFMENTVLDLCDCGHISFPVVLV